MASLGSLDVLLLKLLPLVRAALANRSVNEEQDMGTIPPSDESKHVDRGRRRGSLKRPLVTRRTLTIALRVLALAVRAARFVIGLIDDV